MEKVTAEEIRNAVISCGISDWAFRSCSICKTPLSYIFNSDGVGVCFDSNCDCVRYWVYPTESSYAELADLFNRQTPELRAKLHQHLVSGDRRPAID
jgi:hypothetical protein